MILALVVGAASIAEAQNFNPLKIYDDRTDFTSRGNIGTGQGRVIQTLPGDASAGASLLTRVQFILQDQDTLTQEPYTVEILADDGSGMPDVVNPPLLQVGPFQSPSGAGGAAAWVINVDVTPNLALSCNQSIYMAVALTPNALWSADGLSVHASAQQRGDTREMPKGEPNTNIDLAWQEIGGVVSEPSLERVWNMTFFTDSVALRPFAEIPAFTSVLYGATTARAQDFGQAGRYPDLNDALGEQRFDNIGFKAVGNQYTGTGATAILFMTVTNLGPTCLPLPPYGNLWVDPRDPLFTASFGPFNMTTEDGSGGFTWGPYNLDGYIRSVFASTGVALYTQAIIFDPGNEAISNATTQYY